MGVSRMAQVSDDSFNRTGPLWGLVDGMPTVRLLISCHTIVPEKFLEKNSQEVFGSALSRGGYDYPWWNGELS
jgi:hypothetical protein